MLTVLSRLEAKGIVRRARDGRAHTYEAIAGREEHTADLMRQVLDTAGDRDDALARFVGSVSIGRHRSPAPRARRPLIRAIMSPIDALALTRPRRPADT